MKARTYYIPKGTYAKINAPDSIYHGSYCEVMESTYNAPTRKATDPIAPKWAVRIIVNGKVKPTSFYSERELTKVSEAELAEYMFMNFVDQ